MRSFVSCMAFAPTLSEERSHCGPGSSNSFWIWLTGGDAAKRAKCGGAALKMTGVLRGFASPGQKQRKQQIPFWE